MAGACLAEQRSLPATEPKAAAADAAREIVTPRTALVAEPRTALVIGNANYPQGRLGNPRQDAELMASTLASVGFTVTTVLDADLATMQGAIRDFARRLRAADGIGLFYYAGHGVQVDGENFLIPIGADIGDAREVALSAVNLGEILKAMDHGAAPLNIAILDACRDNPFGAAGRGIGGGLAPVSAPSGTLIAYSTAPGQVALDGVGHNSPYTEALASEVPAAGVALEEVFRRTRRKVLEATQGRQTPWEHSSLTAEFFFRPKTAEPEASQHPDRAKETVEPEAARLAELADWERIKSTSDKAALKRHILRYPNGLFSELAALKLAKLQALESADAGDVWSWITTGGSQPLPKPGEAEKVFERAARLESQPAGTDGKSADPAEIVSLYRKAADMGLAAAIFSLAKAYDRGFGVERNPPEAARLLAKAVEKGHAGAMSALGAKYEFGDGVEPSKAEALKLYRRAAAQNDPQGLTSLAYFYHTGEGVTRNWIEARRLYGLAADRGHSRAMYNLALMLLRGEGGKADQPQALKLLRVAADKGHAGALRELAFLHDEGRGVPKDSKAAAAYLIASYKAGNKDPWLDLRRRPDVWSFATKREVQRQLAAYGLYDGAVTGFINGRTRAALDRLATAD